MDLDVIHNNIVSLHATASFFFSSCCWMCPVAFPSDLSPCKFLFMSDNDTQANPHLFPCTSLLDLFLYLIFPQSCSSRRVSCWDCSSAIYEQDWCLEFPEVPGERQAQRPLVYNSEKNKCERQWNLSLGFQRQLDKSIALLGVDNSDPDSRNDPFPLV